MELLNIRLISKPPTHVHLLTKHTRQKILHYVRKHHDSIMDHSDKRDEARFILQHVDCVDCCGMYPVCCDSLKHTLCTFFILS